MRLSLSRNSGIGNEILDYPQQKTDAEYADDLVKFIGPQKNARVIVDPPAASLKAEMTKRGIWHCDAKMM